jgi:hypothetical protein
VTGRAESLREREVLTSAWVCRVARRWYWESSKKASIVVPVADDDRSIVGIERDGDRPVDQRNCRPKFVVLNGHFWCRVIDMAWHEFRGGGEPAVCEQAAILRVNAKPHRDESSVRSSTLDEGQSPHGRSDGAGIERGDTGSVVVE